MQVLERLQRCQSTGTFRFNCCAVKRVARKPVLVIKPGSIYEGTKNTVYAFQFLAMGISADIKQVQIQWRFGAGSPGLMVIDVIDGVAVAIKEFSYTLPGDYLVVASVSHELTTLALAEAPVHIAGIYIKIDPASTIAEPGDDITFSINAIGFHQENEGDIATISWNFGTGLSSATGSFSKVISDRTIIHAITHTFPSAGMFGLIVTVQLNGFTVAEGSATVVVGKVQERFESLRRCDSWAAARSGGNGVTVNIWDVSALSDGVIIDMDYDAYSLPDRFVIEYPAGNIVHNTGWRGAPRYNDNPNFPGGIVGSGKGEIIGLFTKVSFSAFKVTVFGGGPGTAWRYSVRCRDL